MAPTVPMRAPAHYLRVDLGDPGEAEYWQVVLDASAGELRAAVAAAGPELWNVRAWLSSTRSRARLPEEHDTRAAARG